MHTDVLEPLRPDDVVLLVEPSLQLDQHGHLLTPLGGVRQRPRDARVTPRSIQRKLDRDDVRVVRGGLDEPLDRRGEAVVRVVQEDVALLDHLEDAPRAGQSRLGARMERRIPERGHLQRRQAQQVRRVEQAPGLVDVIRRERLDWLLLLVGELAHEQLPDRRRHERVHFDPHDLREPPISHFLLDEAEQILRLVAVLDLKIGVAGDAERVPPQDLDAREQHLQVRADHLLQRHEPVRRRERNPPRQDLRDLHSGEPLVAVGAAQHDGQREAQVRDVGERMARIDGERRQDGKYVGLEVAVQVVAVRPRQLGNPELEVYALLGKRGDELAHQALLVLPA